MIEMIKINNCNNIFVYLEISDDFPRKWDRDIKFIEDYSIKFQKEFALKINFQFSIQQV